MQQEHRARALASAMRAGCVGARVGRLHRLVVREFERRMRPLGVSLPQLEVLSALALHSDPVRPSRLAELLDTERSTMSRNLAVLQERGLVVTTTASSTGRSLAVAICAEGIAALARAHDAWTHAQEGLLARLGPDAPAALDSWLGALAEHEQGQASRS